MLNINSLESTVLEINFYTKNTKLQILGKLSVCKHVYMNFLLCFDKRKDL